MRERKLPFALRLAHLGQTFGVICLPIVANEGVAGVLAGHEHTAGRSADGVTAIVLGQTHALRRHAVEVRGLDDFLPVATEITRAKIVSEDENDVRLAGMSREWENKQQQADQRLHGRVETAAGAVSCFAARFGSESSFQLNQSVSSSIAVMSKKMR